jgi:hypothetical protein
MSNYGELALWQTALGDSILGYVASVAPDPKFNWLCGCVADFAALQMHKAMVQVKVRIGGRPTVEHVSSVPSHPSEILGICYQFRAAA